MITALAYFALYVICLLTQSAQIVLCSQMNELRGKQGVVEIDPLPMWISSIGLAYMAGKIIGL